MLKFYLKNFKFVRVLLHLNTTKHNSSMKFFLPTLLVFALSISAKAQEKKWTLAECVEFAHKYNLRVKQADLDVKLANNNRQGAMANLLPDLRLNSGYFFNFGLNIDPVTNLPTRDDRQTSSLSLQSNIVLFDGFQNYNRVARGRIEQVSATYQLEAIKNDIGVNVANQYLQVLLNKELLEVANNQVRTSETQVKRATQLVEKGMAPLNEKLQADAQLARDEQNQVTAQNNLDISLLMLAQLMQLRETSNFDVADIQAELEISPYLTYTPLQIFERAQENQPMIKAAENNVILADKDIDISRGQFMPTLALSGQIATNYSNQIPQVTGTETTTIPIGFWDNNGTPEPVFTQQTVPIREGTKPFADQYWDNVFQFVGINLSIPIFTRLQNRNNYRSAVLQYEQARLNLESNRNELLQTIQRAHADALASFKFYMAAEKGVSSSKENLEYAQKRFEVGALNFFDLELARNTFFQARSEQLRAKYDYLFKIKVLEFYMTNQLPTTVK